MDNKQKEVLTRLIQEASAGNPEYIWAEQVIRDMGYARIIDSPEQGKIFCTRRDLAFGLGVSDRMVAEWAKKEMPIYRKSIEGKPEVLDLFAVCKWYVDYKVGELQKKLENDQTKKEYWDAVLAKEKAIQMERKNYIAEGELLVASEVSSQLMEIARVFRAKSELIERQFGQEVGDELREMIDDAEAGWRKVVDIQQAEREAIVTDDSDGLDKAADKDADIS
jgi:phage terminase Nu1 subunit (DNA packaging protein)